MSLGTPEAMRNALIGGGRSSGKTLSTLRRMLETGTVAIDTTVHTAMDAADTTDHVYNTQAGRGWIMRDIYLTTASHPVDTGRMVNSSSDMYLAVDYGRSEERVWASMLQGAWEVETPKELVAAPARDMLVRTNVKVLMPKDTEDVELALAAEDLLGYTPLRDHVQAPSRLLRALAQLDIEPLDQKSVDAYKAQMVQHYATHQKMASPTWRLHRFADLAAEVPKFVLRKAVDIKRALPDCFLYVDMLAVDPFLIVSMVALPDSVYNTRSRDLDPKQAAYVEVWDEPKFEATL